MMAHLVACSEGIWLNSLSSFPRPHPGHCSVCSSTFTYRYAYTSNLSPNSNHVLHLFSKQHDSVNVKRRLNVFFVYINAHACDFCTPLVAFSLTYSGIVRTAVLSTKLKESDYRIKLHRSWPFSVGLHSIGTIFNPCRHTQLGYNLSFSLVG